MLDGQEDIENQQGISIYHEQSNLHLTCLTKILPIENQWTDQKQDPSYPELLESVEVEGPNDWAYGHNRLIIPSSSRITFKFRIPHEHTQTDEG